MRPSSSFQNVIDRSSRDVELAGDFLRRNTLSRKSADLSHLFRSQPGRSVSDTLRPTTLRIAQVFSLGNVRPVLTSNEQTDRFALNAIVSGQLLLGDTPRFVSLAYLLGLFFGQLAATYALTTRYAFRAQAGVVRRAETRPMTTLNCAILSVLFWRTGKEMGGITARRVVARMADKLVKWIASVSKIVGDSMGFEGAMLRLELPVSAREARTFPQPTLTGVTNGNR